MVAARTRAGRGHGRAHKPVEPGRRRYQGGVTSWLESLTAQQALYAQDKALVSTRLAAASNRVALYRALGGDDPVVGNSGN